MKFKNIWLLIVTVSLLQIGCSSKQADVVYKNGKIYTVNEAQPWAEAVVVKDGNFVFVGSSKDAEQYIGRNTKLVDLKGKFAMPGLIDAHTHPFEDYHKEAFQLGLDGSSKEALLASIKKYAKEHSEKKWITGGVWPFGMFKDNNPHRKTLDEIVPDRPVMLIDQGGHSAWLNTKALELVGFMDKDFKTPEKYSISRDADGVPSGLVTEFAIGHVRGFIPEAPLEEWIETGKQVQPLFHKYGITATGIAAANELHVKAARALEDNGELGLHLSFYMEYEYFDSPNSKEEQLKVIEGIDKYNSELIDPKGVKLFVDGSPIAREGWMLEPYKGTDTSGISYYTTGQLTELFVKFEKMNRRVMAHAIGDRAVRDVLNAIEAAKKINPGSTVRHHPTHNTLADPEDIKRFAKLGVAFEVSPVMVLSPGSIKMFDEILGRKLLAQGWALRTAYDSGAMVAMATDWKVSPLNPWHVIGWTVSRINHEYPEMVDIAPEMKITMKEAIKAYTLGAAYSLSKEHEIGSIEVGKYADMIVLNQNLLEIDPVNIEKTQVLETIFMGNTVFPEFK